MDFKYIMPIALLTLAIIVGVGLYTAKSVEAAAGPGQCGGGVCPLVVYKGGSQNGTVTSNPAGINCGSDCSEWYDWGTQVILTATPAPGHTFTGWSGACTGTNTQCTLFMTAPKSTTASFN